MTNHQALKSSPIRRQYSLPAKFQRILPFSIYSSHSKPKITECRSTCTRWPSRNLALWYDQSQVNSPVATRLKIYSLRVDHTFSCSDPIRLLGGLYLCFLTMCLASFDRSLYSASRGHHKITSSWPRTLVELWFLIMTNRQTSLCNYIWRRLVRLALHVHRQAST